ncbi:MAG: tryptophan-rich sensory protein [Sphingomonadaceae bacterium]|nr:tryptophan-rich sensory protein [Sphingomonadaceae bacterium]
MSEIASRGQLRMAFVRVALIAVPLVLFLGLASAVLSGSGDDNAWYAHLIKPGFTPPGWVFALVWTILYVLMGFAITLIVTARGAPGRIAAIALFAVQLVVNLAWSPLFFGAHRVGAAFGVMLLLLLLAIAAAWAMGRVRQGALWLMLPYLAWLCFAALLFHAVWRLNPHAETLAPGGSGTQIML